MSVMFKNNIPRVVAALTPNVVGAVTDTTQAVKTLARATVRRNTDELHDSIETFGSGLKQGVAAGTDHNYAQELGRPDLANYGYTPYMKPSAEAERSRHTARVAEAVRTAMRQR